MTVWKWAEVTGVSPLEITLDNEASPVASVPATLVAGLAVGDRVRVEITDRRLVVHGRIH